MSVGVALGNEGVADADALPADCDARVADAGIDFSLFLSGFADIVRAQLAILLGGDVPDLPGRGTSPRTPVGCPTERRRG